MRGESGRTTRLTIHISPDDRRLLEESAKRHNEARRADIGVTRWMITVAVLASKVEHAINSGLDKAEAVAALVDYLTLPRSGERG
jgi:hypothetical protein